MTTTTTTATPSTTTDLATSGGEQPVSVRHKLSALWVAMLFVFAYVDLFSLYRADVRAQIEAGEMAGFTVGEGFLLATTAYVLVPSVMVFLSLVLPRRVARPATVVLALAYAATIAVGAIGEWGYYVLGSVVEVALLATMVVLARRWPAG